MTSHAVPPEGDAPEVNPDEGATEVTAVPEKFRQDDGTVNTEALLKSYAELEGKLGQPEGEEASSEDANPEDANGGTDEDPAEGNADGSVYSKALDAAMTSAELDPKSVAAEWADNGELSAETREKLDSTFGKDAVDMYIDGWKARAAASPEPTQEPTDAPADAPEGPTEAEQATVTEEIGGQEVLDSLIEWAGDNLSAEDTERFNKQVNGDVNSARMALEWLREKRASVEGFDPKVTLKGDSNPANVPQDVFADFSEVTAAMSKRNAQGKKLYVISQAYRDAVAAKLKRSKL